MSYTFDEFKSVFMKMLMHNMYQKREVNDVGKNYYDRMFLAFNRNEKLIKVDGYTCGDGVLYLNVSMRAYVMETLQNIGKSVEDEEDKVIIEQDIKDLYQNILKTTFEHLFQNIIEEKIESLGGNDYVLREQILYGDVHIILDYPFMNRVINTNTMMWIGEFLNRIGVGTEERERASEILSVLDTFTDLETIDLTGK